METLVRQRVKELILKKGVTYNKLALLCEIPQSNVAKQLGGDTAISLKTILAILNRLPDVSAEWLLRGEGDMIKPTSFLGKVVNKIESAFPCGDSNETSVRIYEDLLEQRDRRIRELEIELAKVKHSEREMMVAAEGNPIKPYNA